MLFPASISFSNVQPHTQPSAATYSVRERERVAYLICCSYVTQQRRMHAVTLLSKKLLHTTLPATVTAGRMLHSLYLPLKNGHQTHHSARKGCMPLLLGDSSFWIGSCILTSLVCTFHWTPERTQTLPNDSLVFAVHYYIGTRREFHVSRERIKCIIQKKGSALKALAEMYLKLVFAF